MLSIKTILPLLLLVVAGVTTPAFAAKPKSVKYIEDIVTDSEEIYSHYVVACTDGKEGDVSAWDNRKHWCPGKGVKDDPACSKKQIKTAKQVCKGG